MQITLDAELILAAAEAAGIDTTLTPGEQARAVLRQIAGQESESRSKEGAALKRSGREWELRGVAYANEQGFAWDVAPLRGRRDLLDFTGCLDSAGLLVGAKARETGVPMSQKLWRAMEQCHRAMEHLPRSVDPSTVVPFQLIQRRDTTIGGAYAVTEYDWLLRLARERRQLRASRQP